jgi:hypothetical protein
LDWQRGHCPRGAHCEFAHGAADLSGPEKEKVLMKNEAQQISERQKRKDEYLKPIFDSQQSDDAVLSMVMEGMSESSSSVKRQKRETTLASASRVNTTDIRILAGQVIVENAQHSTIIIGGSKFASVQFDVTRTTEKCSYLYYEAELVTCGLMQMGWIDVLNFVADDLDGSGVGDDANSWGYDGSRQISLLQGDESPIISDNTNSWDIGDVVGCLLQEIDESEIEKGRSSAVGKLVRLVFYLNGKKMFHKDFATSIPISRMVGAISLEEKESVVLNTGRLEFKFPPQVDNS